MSATHTALFTFLAHFSDGPKHGARNCCVTLPSAPSSSPSQFPSSAAVDGSIHLLSVAVVALSVVVVVVVPKCIFNLISF